MRRQCIIITVYIYIYIYNLGELFLAVATTWSPKAIYFCFRFVSLVVLSWALLAAVCRMFPFCFPFVSFGEFLFYTALGCRCHLLLLATPIKTLLFVFFFNDFLVSWEVGGLGRAGVVLFRA